MTTHTPQTRLRNLLVSAAAGAVLVTAGAAGYAVRDAAIAPDVAASASAPAPTPTPALESAQTSALPESRRDSYADLVERVTPAVVTVRASKIVQTSANNPEADDLLRRFFGGRGGMEPQGPRRQGGLGSGVVVSPDGYILTNAHVVDSATKLRVEFGDGRGFDARIVGTDQPSDLAVLKIDAAKLPTVPFGNSDRSRVGDVVLAIGNPLGIGQTVTMGIVSAKGRQTGISGGGFEDFIQTDAPINQGNSGGALINTRGELVGINSAIISPTGGNIGIGFAIPVNMAQNVMDQLVKGGKVRRGMLGVTIQPVTAELAEGLGLTEVRGAIVSNVVDDSPASRAGVKQGDIITKIDGVAVVDSNSLRNQIARTRPDTAVSLTVVRDGKELTVKPVLQELPAERASANGGAEDTDDHGFGLTVEPLTPETAERLGASTKRGVVVRDVDDTGAAADAGIRPGDVILAVNRKPVASVSELRAALKEAGKKAVVVLLDRRGQNLFLTIGTRPS